MTGPPTDVERREIVRRVLTRLRSRRGATPAPAADRWPVEGLAVPSAGASSWRRLVPPEIRGVAEGRWDEPSDESVGVASPTRGPGAGRCLGCPTPGACAWVCPATSVRILREGASRLGASGGARALAPEVAGRIDHTLLSPEATEADVDTLCDEAARYRFASVCVNGCWVPRATERLRGTGVPVCAVVGFPLGATLTEVKVEEARRAVEEGACEIDMVMNVGALRSRAYGDVARDIRAVVRAAAVPVKVILETALLSRDEKVEACTLAKAAGAAFVKTSTGFGPSGATVDDVRLMRQVVGEDVSIKASGGIRDAETAQRMMEAGADRIGASASVRIVEGQTSR